MDFVIATQASLRILFGNLRIGTRSNYVPPPPPTSIDNLPPELLAIVLKKEKLTLPQLIARRIVSSQWQEVIEQHVLKLTTKLLLSDNKYDDSESIRLPSKAELIPLLIRLFPALTNLNVRLNLEVIPRLPELLTAFNSTLTTLKLMQSFHPDIDDQQWITNLTSAINSLTALTSLNLKHLPNTSEVLPQLLPTFTRLQRFKIINQAHHLVETWSSITANQPLTSMTRLMMNGVTRFDCTALLLDIVATFPSLQSLDLHLESRVRGFQNIIDIFRSLSTLKHLSELTLGYLFYSPDQQSQLPSPTDQPLTQVKTLHLIFNNIIGSELLSSLLVGWFPSIEKFTLSRMYNFQLTTTTLRNLARLQQLKEFVLKDDCLLEVELLIAPTDRPLTSLKKLSVIIATEQFCSSAFVGWFPSLVELSLKFDSSLPLTTAFLRDFSHLEHLSNLKLSWMRFEADQLHLPTSKDRRRVNVKTLTLNIYPEPEDDSVDGRYLCTALAAWFPNLRQLTMPDFCIGHDVFIPSISMFSEFATLEHLTEWRLNIENYTKDHFPLPTSTDRVLSNLKELFVVIDVWSGNHIDDGDERHLLSVLAAWFPNLEKLIVVLVYKSEFIPFHLTTDLLRELGPLEHLHELKLPLMLYDKKHLQAPSPTDRPLTCLKELRLDMAELPENFDAQYFCSTLSAWFPHIEKIHIGPHHFSHDDHVLKDRLTAYKTAIETNRHHFGRLVQLRTEFEPYY